MQYPIEKDYITVKLDDLIRRVNTELHQKYVRELHIGMQRKI